MGHVVCLDVRSSHLLILVTLQHTEEWMGGLFKHTPLLRSSLWSCCCSHQCFAWNKSASFLKSRRLYMHVPVRTGKKRKKKTGFYQAGSYPPGTQQSGTCPTSFSKPPPLIQQSPSYSERQTEAHREKTSKTLTTPQTPGLHDGLFLSLLSSNRGPVGAGVGMPILKRK